MAKMILKAWPEPQKQLHPRVDSVCAMTHLKMALLFQLSGVNVSSSANETISILSQ